MAALRREQTGGRVKVSLRSLGEVDVSRVALLHGGGGHAAAAGCTLVGGLDECAAIIASELSDEIARARKAADCVNHKRRTRAARGLEWTDL